MHSPNKRKFKEGSDASQSVKQDGRSGRKLKTFQKTFRSQQHLPIWKARDQLIAELKVWHWCGRV